MAAGELWSVLLANGRGDQLPELTRLASGAVVPEQYCALVGSASLLRLALARALRISPAERTLAVVSARHRHWWRRDLPELPRANRLVEPAERGSAAAVLLAAREVWRRDHEGVLLLLPADQCIEHEWRFAIELVGACELARRRPRRVVVIGVEPAGAESACGWLVPDPGRRRKRAVAALVDAPAPDAVPELLERGGVIHTHIVAARAATLLEAFDDTLPQTAECFRQAAALHTGHLAALYRAFEPADFTRDVLGRVPSRLELVVAPRCGWTDLDTAERIEACVEHGGPPVTVFGHAPAAPVELASELAHTHHQPPPADSDQPTGNAARERRMETAVSSSTGAKSS